MCILRILCVLLAGSMCIGWAATFDKNRGAKTLSDLDSEQPEQSTDAAVSTKTAKETEKRFEWNKRTIGDLFWPLNRLCSVTGHRNRWSSDCEESSTHIMPGTRVEADSPTQ